MALIRKGDAEIGDRSRKRSQTPAQPLPGIFEAFAGRRGDPSPDDRIVASLWVDFDAMTSALGEAIEASPFHPGYSAGARIALS